MSGCQSIARQAFSAAVDQNRNFSASTIGSPYTPEAQRIGSPSTAYTGPKGDEDSKTPAASVSAPRVRSTRSKGSPRASDEPG